MTALSRKNRNLGAVVIAGIVGLCIFVFGGILERLTRPGGQEVTATFKTTARLATGSPVRIRGVEAGRVSARSYDETQRVAKITMTIFDDAGPLYDDARAEVQWRSVLGSNYAINLDPGTRAAGPLGSDGLDLRHTSSQVEVDELLTTLQSRPRDGLRTVLATLPEALAEPDSLSTAAATLSDTAPTLTRALRAVRGQQDGDLRRLIRNSAATARGLDSTRRTVQDVIEGGAVTLQTTGDHAADIQASLETLSRRQPAIQATLRELRGTLDLADPLLADLDDAAPALAPTAEELRPLLIDADDVLSSARPLLRSLQPAARSLASAARTGAPVLRDLQPILRRATDRILPDLAKRDSVTGRATYEMIGPTIASLTAAAAVYDSVSHIVTLSGGGGERALDTLPCSTYFTDPTATQLATCEELGGYLQRLLGGGDGTSGEASR